MLPSSWSLCCLLAWSATSGISFLQLFSTVQCSGTEQDELCFLTLKHPPPPCPLPPLPPLSLTHTHTLTYRDSSSSSLVEKDITSLSLHDPPHPITAQMATTPASKEEPVTTSTLLSQSLDSLASLCSVYLQSLAKGGQCTEKQVKQSKLVISANDIHSQALACVVATL